MKKNYIKLNIDDNHLSFGNLCRHIKSLSKNKSSAMQGEIFSCLFETDIVNDTTVNNYCVGIRSINDTYKQTYLIYQKKYEINKEILKPIIENIISIMDGIINTKSFNVNNSTSLKLLCNKLYNISKNDQTCSDEFTNSLHTLIEENNLLEAFSNILFFCILEKKQPIYESDLKVEIIENVLNDTNISANDLQEYLNIRLSEEVNFNIHLKQLAEKGNAYACFELGLQEFRGYYAGYPRYIEALNYFKKASLSNHAQSYYMIARMYYDKKIEYQNKEEIKKIYDYLLKSYKLGSVAATNLLGLYYLHGIEPCEKNIAKAKKYFEEAGSKGYSYSYNNLGYITEKNNLEKAINYYKKSAELGDSWALNKLGEYYRNKNDYKNAFTCYNESIDGPFANVTSYAYYNLAKYFYLNGNPQIGLSKDINKAIEYYKTAITHNNFDAMQDLFYYYIEEYLKNKLYYKEIIELKEKIEKHNNYNEEIKYKIENKMLEIKKDISINLDIIK